MIIGDKADAFQNALTGKPKATVEIWFEPKDGEAFFFAQMIFVNLRSAGWEGTSVPTPIPELPSNNPSDASLPLAMRATGGMKSSLCLLAKELPQVSNESRDNFPFGCWSAPSRPQRSRAVVLRISNYLKVHFGL